MRLIQASQLSQALLAQPLRLPKPLNIHSKNAARCLWVRPVHPDRRTKAALEILSIIRKYHRPRRFRCVTQLAPRGRRSKRCEVKVRHGCEAVSRKLFPFIGAEMDKRARLGDQDSAASAEPDASLSALEEQFIILAAELDRGGADLGDRDDEYLTAQDEAVLARLDPIERAIMETPAHTIIGLSVKARHLAYVVSEYWEAPIDQIEWQGRAIRLLVEAICNIADAPLHISGPQPRK